MLTWIGRRNAAAPSILAVSLLTVAACADDGSQDEMGSVGDTGDTGDGDGDGGNNCPEGGANSGAPRVPDLGAAVLTEVEEISNISSAAAGDFNGDGIDDLVLAKIGNARFFAGNGDGTLSQGVELEIDPGTTFLGAARSGDFDGDGTVDLLLGIQSVDAMAPTPAAIVWGGATFPQDVTTVAGSALLVRADTLGVGDIDGDGNLDLAGSSPSGSFAAYGDGQRGFTQAQSLSGLPLGTVLAGDDADVDADGRAEVLGTSFVFEYFVVDVNGDRDQSTDSFAGWGAIGARPVWRDLNGDDAADIVIGGSTHIYVAWNDGDGNFEVFEAGEYCTTMETLLPGGSPFFGVADFDRDGELDIAVGDSQANELRFLFGQSNTRDFTNYASLPAADFDPGAVIPADYTGDGIVDVGVLHVAGGGKGSFAVHPGL